jgi:hypothetical protein
MPSRAPHDLWIYRPAALPGCLFQPLETARLVIAAHQRADAARTNGLRSHRLGLRQDGRGLRRITNIDHRKQITNIARGLTGRQRLHVKNRFDHLQYRSVVEDGVIDGRVRRRAHGPGRRHHAGAAAAQQSLAIHQVRIGIVRRQRAGRRYMVKELLRIRHSRFKTRGPPPRPLPSNCVFAEKAQTRLPDWRDEPNPLPALKVKRHFSASTAE